MSEKPENHNIWCSDLSWLRQRVTELEAAYSLSLKPDNAAHHIEKLLQTVFKSVLHRQRAEEALVWEASVNRATAEVSQGLIYRKPIQEIANLAVKHALALTGSRYGFAWRLDPETNGMVPLLPENGNATRSETRSALYKTCTSLCKRVQENKSLLSISASTGPKDDSDSLEEGRFEFSIICVPALVGDRVLGNMSLAKAEGEYERRDVEALRLLSGFLGLAIERMLAESKLGMQDVNPGAGSKTPRSEDMPTNLPDVARSVDEKRFDLGTDLLF